MQYSIHHRTVYHYEHNVSYSHHLARLTPVETRDQSEVTSRLVVDPASDILTSHRDYYGNVTTYFSLTSLHRSLAIESLSDVAIEKKAASNHTQVPPAFERSPAWESVRERLRTSLQPGDLKAFEFTFPSPLCPVNAELADYAGQSFLPGRPVLEAAMDFTARLHTDFTFDSKATPVIETFQRRAGVCQDFAHLQIACLRSLGLPASYVSGYLRTIPPPGKKRLIGADASHA